MPALLAMYAVAAASPPLPPPGPADFARLPEFGMVTISPNGEYLAAKVRARDGGQYGLGVIRLSDRKVIGRFDLGPERDLADYWWVGPDRLVMQPAQFSAGYLQPWNTGELLAMNADGSGQAYLFGINGGRVSGTRVPHVAWRQASARMVQPLPDDPDHAIVSIQKWGTSEEGLWVEAYKLDVHSGALSERVVAPARGETEFLADRQGTVRYALSHSPDFLQAKTYVREQGQWRMVNAGELENARIEPLRMSRDEARVYLRSNEIGGRYCLIEQTLATGARRALSCDDAADVADYVTSFDGRGVVAAVYEDGRPRIVPLDPQDPEAATLQGLQASFPGAVVLPVSSTADGSKVVLQVYSDRDPGAWCLFDVRAKKAEWLVSARDWIDPAQMGERRPIVFAARDGQKLHGFLTLPPDREPRALPLVVLPHGGPFHIQDLWQWDADAQLLASHGYAVLQVNFRGSGGYGLEFLDAGKQRVDSVMLDDLDDGLSWTLAQGFADPRRVCIYGGSYGGYAALMSAVREPDRYRCVVDYAGVYDLPGLREDTDATQTRSGQRRFDEYFGGDPERLKAASPSTYIDRLRAPVLIVHGKSDARVPYGQALALRKALDARHLPYEWDARSGEAHSYYDEDNRAGFYTRLLAFLDAHIGAAALPAAATAPSSP